MELRFWRSAPAPKQIPQQIQHIVRHRLRISSEEMATLLIVEHQGTFAGRPVRYFRAFDPSALNGLASMIRYDQLSAHPSAVIFDGHSERNGSIVVYDRRKPASA